MSERWRQLPQAFAASAGVGLANTLTLGCLPALMWQGRRLMQSLPDVPEAPGDRHGLTRPAGQEGPGAPLRLLVIGESTAAGVGAPHQTQALANHTAQAWSDRAGRDVRWHMVGRSGLRAAEVRRYLVPLIPPPAAATDLAVVVLGVNDSRTLTQSGVWRRHMRALVHEVRARARVRHVLCTGVPPMADFPALPRPLRDVLGRRALRLDRALGAALADLSWATHVPFRVALEPHLFCEDGVHPGPQGYAAWGQLLARHAPDHDVP